MFKFHFIKNIKRFKIKIIDEKYFDEFLPSNYYNSKDNHNLQILL